MITTTFCANILAPKILFDEFLTLHWKDIKLSRYSNEANVLWREAALEVYDYLIAFNLIPSHIIIGCDYTIYFDWVLEERRISIDVDVDGSVGAYYILISPPNTYSSIEPQPNVGSCEIEPTIAGILFKLRFNRKGVDDL